MTDVQVQQKEKPVLTVLAVVLVVAYAVLATRWVNADPGWYEALPKPSWQPPDWVFGVMWPYNFLALGVAGVVLTRTAPTSTAGLWLGVLALDVVLALLWAYLFYVPHALSAAAVALGAAAVVAWALVAVAARGVPWTGLLVAPYALWLTVATTLAVGFATGAGASQGQP